MIEGRNITLPAPAQPFSDHAEGSGQCLINAATEIPYAYVTHAVEVDVDAAVQRARHAFEHGPWRRMSAAERGATLHRSADAIIAHSEELAVLHTLETGIPIAQARSMHVPRCADNIRFFGELINSLAGESYEQTGRYLSIVTREPIGIGLLIAPWNAPLVLASMKMGACLALGNSMIVKPSEYAPLSVLRMVELMHGAGVPEDVLQVLCGTGATAGKRLLRTQVSTRSALWAEPTRGDGSWQWRQGRLKKSDSNLGGNRPTSSSIAPILIAPSMDRY